MSILKDVLEEEYERLSELINEYKKRIKSYPKGYISIKDINGHKYAYLSFRDNDNIRSKYLGNPLSNKVKEIKKQITDRKDYLSKLKKAEKNFKEVKKALGGKRFKLFLNIISVLDKKHVLKNIILIGSWAQYYYRIYFNNSSSIPPVRTLDLDFLIPNPLKIKKDINVTEILEELGFDVVTSYITGHTKYVHPDLEIEFLIPELGKGQNGPYKIKKLHINATGLRLLNFLQHYTIKVTHEGIGVRVPEPAAYILHKFIISERRKNKAKQKKDLNSAKVISEFLLQDKKQKKKLKDIYNNIPGKWQNKIKKNIKNNCIVLYEFLCK